MRVLAIALRCGAMACFTGLDTCSKWLESSLPVAQIVWARYVGAALIALAVARPGQRVSALRSKRPRLQALRSILLLGSTGANVIALLQLQLAETATISFLTPIFVGLMAGPVLGEAVGGERAIAIVIGFLGVLIATRPGTSAFHPVVFVAIAGVVCNSGYVLTTRKLAGYDGPLTTFAWTQAAGLVLLTPLLPWVWYWPASVRAWLVIGAMGAFAAAGHGLLIVAHKFAPAPALTPFSYTQLVWMILSGWLVFADWPSAPTLAGAALVVACGVYLTLREREREAGGSRFSESGSIDKSVLGALHSSAGVEARRIDDGPKEDAADRRRARDLAVRSRPQANGGLLSRFVRFQDFGRLPPSCRL